MFIALKKSTEAAIVVSRKSHFKYDHFLLFLLIIALLAKFLTAGTFTETASSERNLAVAWRLKSLLLLLRSFSVQLIIIQQVQLPCLHLPPHQPTATIVVTLRFKCFLISQGPAHSLSTGWDMSCH